MSRVLFLVNHDVVIYNFRLELVEELLHRNYEVFISSPYGERIDDLVRIGAIHKDISIDRHGMNPLRDLRLIQQYKGLIKEIKPDIVCSYTIKPNIYGAIAARKCNVPCIANITGLGIAMQKSGIKQKICIYLYKKAFRNIKKVFFQNKANQEFFELNKIAVGKQKLLPGSGVNTKRYPYQLFPQRDTFLFIARIMKDKGIDLFLEAAEHVKQLYKNVDFIVCGFCDDKSYNDKLVTYQEMGIIKYQGMVRNTLQYYALASCVVLPSYHEGMSNTLLEAASCGRPLIASNIPGCSEAIDDNETGFLTKCGNVSDLIDKMVAFLNLSFDEKKEMGKKGREKMKKQFERGIIVYEYLKEIENG